MRFFPKVSRQGPSLDAVPRRIWIRLGWIYLVLGVVALIVAPLTDREAWWVHGLWCMTGLAIALPTLSRAFRQGFTVVLTDHRLMFLASFALYFLFGASLPAIGPEFQADYSLSHFPIFPGEAVRADAVNGLGFGVAMLTAGFARGAWLGAKTARVAGVVSRLPPTWAVGFFLIVGTAASYYVLSFDLGFRFGFAPGVVRMAGQLSLVAIFLAASRFGRGSGWLRLFGILVALALASTSLLQFNKSAVLMPLASLVAGLALRFGSRRVLPIGLPLLVVVFMSIGNVTSYARQASINERATPLFERWTVLVDAWALSTELRDVDEYIYWSRLCYVPSQVAAQMFYDEGRGGDGLQLMWWVAVPRFLAPQKPEITKTGRELHEKITGQSTSADGQGIFSSGYYHGGWFGLVLASVLCGWIIAQTSAIARAIYVNHALLMLPLSLFGLFIAFRIDGDFVSDYLGAFMFIVYPILAVTLILSAETERRPVGATLTRPAR